MLEIVHHEVVSSVPQILAALDTALQNKSEGIMIKVGASHYVPGERKLKWLKLKPDHIAGMADTLDLIVLGAYYGTKYGVRHLSHFLLGVFCNNVETPRSSDAQFLTLCKVGTGYTERELHDLLATLDAKWITLPEGSVPSWLGSWRPQAGDAPQVFIHPKDSIVMEVYGYSFVPTTKFSVGYTIRFPRCHRVRADKGIEDATDHQQLQSIMDASSKGAKRVRDTTEIVTVRAVRRARHEEQAKAQSTLPRRTIACVPSTVIVPSAKDINGAFLSDIFNGYEICVLQSDATVMERSALERHLLSHGASIVAHPQSQTSLILASSPEAIKVKSWVAACTKEASRMQDRYAVTDIVSVEWALECVRRGCVLPLAPRHMLYTSERLQEQFRRTLDCFHDSFYDDATIETARESLSRAMEASHDHQNRTASVHDFAAVAVLSREVREKRALVLPTMALKPWGPTQGSSHSLSEQVGSQPLEPLDKLALLHDVVLFDAAIPAASGETD